MRAQDAVAHNLVMLEQACQALMSIGHDRMQTDAAGNIGIRISVRREYKQKQFTNLLFSRVMVIDEKHVTQER